MGEMREATVVLTLNVPAHVTAAALKVDGMTLVGVSVTIVGEGE